jgi:hypothetical protein
MVWYNLEQRVFLYDTYVKYGSARKCRRKFIRKFRDERIPRRQRVHSFVNTFISTGVLADKRQKHKRRALIVEKLVDTGTRLNIHLENH